MATLHTDDPKGLREALYVAQAALTHSKRFALQKDFYLGKLSNLIKQLDEHRPIGTDGNLHTPTCGCEEVSA